MKYTAKKKLLLLEALAELSPESSKTTLRSWLKEQRVLVDGQLAKLPQTVVEIGQEVSLRARHRFIKGDIRLYYEDAHLVVIEKPAGLLSVSTAFELETTAHALLKEHYRTPRVYVVHRIDQDTSGVMLFARSEEARDRLKATFEKHDIERGYLALVEGKVLVPKGTWSSYLYEDDRYVVHTTEDPTKGRLATTHFAVESTFSHDTLLRLKLETGRKNQIRVHCKEAGHPIVGDKKYGATRNPYKGLCLHAYLLGFNHPMTGKAMRFEAPLPQWIPRCN
jgi:23S rRNA pseudouridine1911/1915/1917 synthase